MGAHLRTPTEILALPASGADELLAGLEAAVPAHPTLLEMPRVADGIAFVFGDTHGDWRSVAPVVRAFEAAGPSARLIGLGDYVDRTPPDLPGGSAANALYLLGLVARWPDRVVLLQGNHETVRTLALRPRDLPKEVERLWGPSATRVDRIVALLERGPLAATVPCGAYLAHGGFPQGPLPTRWQEAFARRTERLVCELVWAECDAAHSHREVVPAWTGADLERFLSATGLTTVWRGHDPDLTGRPLYDGRAMTLQTTRVYARYGVVYARLPLDRPLPSVRGASLVPVPAERPDAGR